MYIMFNVESVALKKSNSLCFVSKGKFLKNDGVKINDENMINSTDWILSPHGSENEGTCFFFGDSLNKNIPRKKITRLLNEESIHFEVFWKRSASKTYKNSHQ